MEQSQVDQGHEKSGLYMYSNGVVLQDSDTGILEVSPVEKLNTQEPGFMELKTKEIQSKHPGQKGEEFTTKLKRKNTVTATWLAIGGGAQITPPHMFKNELVLLWKFANDEQYYWTRLDSHKTGLRRAERAVYKWSNAPKDSKNIFTEMGYTVDINPKEGYLQFFTEKSQEEKAHALLRVDLKKGTLDIKIGAIIFTMDHVSNKVLIDVQGDCKITADTIYLDTDAVNVKGSMSVGGTLGANEMKTGKIQAGEVAADEVTAGKISIKEGAGGGLKVYVPPIPSFPPGLTIEQIKKMFERRKDQSFVDDKFYKALSKQMTDMLRERQGNKTTVTMGPPAPPTPVQPTPGITEAPGSVLDSNVPAPGYDPNQGLVTGLTTTEIINKLW